jgi:hypothetical protein
MWNIWNPLKNCLLENTFYSAEEFFFFNKHTNDYGSYILFYFIFYFILILLYNINKYDIILVRMIMF